MGREAHGKAFTAVRGVICPSAVYLAELEHLPAGFYRGAQNVFSEKSGAYTGEISPLMLRDLGVEYVIVGHSERRHYGKETDHEVRKKMLSALKHHLTPIVCVGETAAERRTDQTEAVLERQVRALFSDLSKLQAESIILAYEPRWAIGSGELPSSQEILQIKVMVRKILTELFDSATAERISLVYGGSVKSTFLGAVSWESGMNGVLVGRESLFPHEIVKMMSLFEAEATKENE